ncbi:MAG TPA: hypothetical protein VK674_00495 [Candidatus Limnocylindria bacterium]|nr:hypothetical protein [Candidatus Limnocylindria bacterium]
MSDTGPNSGGFPGDGEPDIMMSHLWVGGEAFPDDGANYQGLYDVDPGQPNGAWAGDGQTAPSTTWDVVLARSRKSADQAAKDHGSFLSEADQIGPLPDCPEWGYGPTIYDA